MEDNDRFVDELLDSALAHQRRAEPHPGFEGRIMERVHAAASERDTGTNVWKLWVAAAATAAVVVTFVAIYVANRPHNPAPQISQAENAVSAPSPTETLKANSDPNPAAGAAMKVAEPKQVARSERKSSRQVEAHRWPSQFPTPAPLTAEEKALVQYVQQTPPQVLAEPNLKREPTVQNVEIKPLEIPSLEIEPLALGPTGKATQ